jgi:hypothetical protein
MGYYNRRRGPARRTYTTVHPNGSKTRRTTDDDWNGRVTRREVRHPNGTKTVTYAHPTAGQWFWIILFAIALLIAPAKYLGLWSIPIYLFVGLLLLAKLKDWQQRHKKAQVPSVPAPRPQAIRPTITAPVSSPAPCKYCGASSGGRCHYCGAPR